MKWILATTYLLAIVLANWLIQQYGLITLLPGIMAPAGVFCAGLTFPCRDFIQRVSGKWLSIIIILIGAGISYLISPRLAFASGLTFLISEGLDATIYTPIRKRFGWAVILSSLLALTVDSLLFLHLAHIPYSIALPGQLLGKTASLIVFGLPGIVMLRKHIATT